MTISNPSLFCATREECWPFLSRMIIEHQWLMSDRNYHPSLKKLIAPFIHIVLFLTSAGIGPFFYKKWMGISSRHNGRTSSFPPATAGALTRHSKCSIFHSLFYAGKGPFSCTCWKKLFSVLINLNNSLIFCQNTRKWIENPERRYNFTQIETIFTI